ncbi:MAG: hypothetical protein J7L42_02830, partial [Elusimicrobia bacterium]|nr:hypothetical protein [Elusimicrobiota bacterium]
HPTLFFTENDLVCYFYAILRPKLGVFNDQDGHKHSLIHTEYPTPFRCNMSNNKFELKKDNTRTEKGRKYRRGHYDIVVLNPDFIKQYSYVAIKAQDYKLYKLKVLSVNNIDGPPILYGVEFMFSRDPLKFSRGNDKEKGIDKFVKKVIQDADKLLASKEIEGFKFMAQIKMLIFIKGSSKEIRSLLRDKLSDRDEIILCFGD